MTSHARARRRVGLRWFVAGVLTALVAGAAALAGLLPGSATAEQESPGWTATAARDANQQAGLVAQEDHRLDEVRAVTAVAPLQGPGWNKPYRLSTGAGYTLVLTQRSAPYTIKDLLQLAPQTFTRQSDGAYLLSENLYVNAGAKLLLANPGGLTIHLTSNTAGFVSIVSFGGSLTLAGTPQSPVKISSWDPQSNRPDDVVSDGRAYLRAIGGQFTMDNTRAGELGFWSGRTGGISLTGTDRPNTGSTADSATHLTKTQRHAAKQERIFGGGPAEPQDAPGAGDVYASPAGPLDTPDSRYSVPSQSYVSAKVTNTHIDRDAFGLFVSSANGVQIANTTVTHSLIDGVVLHRFASNAVINNTRSTDNGGDGFVLARATEQIQISAATASRNGGDGFRLTGQALSDGPSASGQPTTAYGNNSVSNSDVADNGRYGIEVIGGINIGVQNNRVTGSEMGIVARQDARAVTIVGNQLSHQSRQGVSVRDGVAAGTISGNVVQNSPTGIYLRDAVATIRGNTVQDASNHGVSLLGHTDGSSVQYNTVAGIGPSAVDTSRAHGKVKVLSNQTFGWHDTTSLWRKIRSKASPMTILWICVIALVLASAFRARRHTGRSGPGNRHPYAHQQRLQSTVEGTARQGEQVGV